MTLCRGLCRYVDTDAAGSFSSTGAEANDDGLHLPTFDADLGWADLLVFVPLADGEQLVESTPLALGQLRRLPPPPA